jgi:DNA-3-methyladenine glycosylase II
MGDLGLKTAVARLYSVERDDLKKIEEISLQWSPNRSLASRYLWRSLDNEKNVKLA